MEVGERQSFPKRLRKKWLTREWHKYDKLYSEYTAARKEKGLFAERKAQKVLDTANNFYEFNCTELTLFDAADKYLRSVFRERFDPKKLPPIMM